MLLKRISIASIALCVCAAVTLAAGTVFPEGKIVPNAGQWDRNLHAFWIGDGAQVHFRSDGIEFYSPTRNVNSRFRLEFRNATLKRRPAIGGASTQLHFVGFGDEDFHTRAVDSLLYGSIWPGIDLRWSAGTDGLKYEFVVEPGSDPGLISMQIPASVDLEVGQDGSLVARLGNGSYREMPPVSWQIIDGERREVESRFVRLDAHSWEIRVGDYDRRYPLVVDPCLSLEYSTYFGGGGYEIVTDMAVDSAGNSYATGFTQSFNFPLVPDPGGSRDQSNYVFVSKLSPDGSRLLYSTIFGPHYSGPYLEGGSITRYESIGEAIAVSPAGEAVVGFSTNGSLSGSGGAYQVSRTPNATGGPCGSFGGQNYDAFVVRLSPDGVPEWSTYVGGGHDDYVADLSLGSDGSVALTGYSIGSTCAATGDSISFPQTGNAVLAGGSGWRKADGYLAVLESDGSSLRFASLVGGSSNDYPAALDRDASGNLYLLGSTNSEDLPTTPGSFRPRSSSSLSAEWYDLFLLKLDNSFRPSHFTYLSDGWSGATHLGFGGYGERRGSPAFGFDRADRQRGLLVQDEDLVIVGTTARAVAAVGVAGPAAFTDSRLGALLFRIDLAGNRITATQWINGNDFDAFGGMAFDADRNVAVAVTTESENIPITPVHFQSELRGDVDAAVYLFSPDLSAMEFGSYFGGSAPSAGVLYEQRVTGMAGAIDGSLYMFGGVTSLDFPTTPGALRRTQDYYSGWITKFAPPTSGRLGGALELRFEPELCGDVKILDRNLFNSGNAPLTIDSIVFLDGTGFSIVNRNDFPMEVLPCDTARILIAFDGSLDVLPCDRGVRDSLFLYTSNTEERLTVLPLRARKSCLSLSLRGDSIVDPDHALGSMRSYSTLAMIGGEEYQSITITPDPNNDPVFSVQGDWTDRVVNRGVESIRIATAPQDTGTYCGRFFVESLPCEFRDTISVCFRAVSPFFRISPDTIDLGVIGCRTTSIPVAVWNEGNDTLLFRHDRTLGPSVGGIRFSTGWEVNRVLLPGDTLRFDAEIEPGGIGERRFMPIYTTNELRQPTFTQTIVAELDTAVIDLQVADLVGSWGDVLEVPLRVDPVRLGRSSVSEVFLKLRYDPGLLDIVELVQEGALSEGWEVIRNFHDPDGRVIHLRADTEEQGFFDPGVLAHLKVRVLRGEDTATTITSELLGISASCLEEIEDSAGFILSAECRAYDRLISDDNRLLRPIFPNPVQEFLAVSIKVSDPTSATVELLDMSGSTVLRHAHQSESAGVATIVLPTSQLPGGTYFCRVVTSEGIRDIREVRVVR